MNKMTPLLADPVLSRQSERTRAPGRISARSEPSAATGLLVFVAAAIGAYFFSLWYLDVYYGGDLAHYRNFYDAVARTQPANWAKMQTFYIGSSEPAYRWLIGLSTYLDVTRIGFISFWNGALVGAVSLILYRYRVSPIFVVLLFTNFYFLILLGPAERLKFAYLLFAFAFLIQQTHVRAGMALLSIFFHTQALVQFLSAGIYFVVENRRLIFENPTRVILAVLGGAVVGSISLYFFVSAVGNSILNKSQIYATRSEGLVEMIPWALLLFAGGYLFRGRLAYIAAMMPLGALTFLFGNRTNIATLAMFATLAIFQRQTQHPVILAVMAYMSYKSISYFQNILAYGSGFS